MILETDSKTVEVVTFYDSKENKDRSPYLQLLLSITQYNNGG